MTDFRTQTVLRYLLQGSSSMLMPISRCHEESEIRQYIVDCINHVRNKLESEHIRSSKALESLLVHHNISDEILTPVQIDTVSIKVWCDELRKGVLVLEQFEQEGEEATRLGQLAVISFLSL